MSTAEQEVKCTDSVPEGPPRYKLLPAVRKKLLSEFQLKPGLKTRGRDEIASQLGQEPYNMISNRSGDRKPSTQWRITVEQLWAINNVLPVKGRFIFENTLKYENQRFERRVIYQEPVFQADLLKSLRDQFKEMEYYRMYTDVLNKYDHASEQEYTTLLIKIKV
jgi:hypothetical protein